MLKMKNIYLLCFLILFFFSSISFSQTNKDSLLALLPSTNIDSQRVVLINTLIDLIEEDTIWQPLNDEMGMIAQRMMKQNNGAINRIGTIHYAAYCNNIGFVHQQNGDMPQALNFYLEGLKYYEASNDKYGIANSLGNIGTVYDEQGDWQQALVNIKQCLSIMTELKDKTGMAVALNNLGTIYNNHGLHKEALNYLEQSLALHKQTEDIENQGLVLSNIGGVYDKLNDNEKAIEYYKASYDIQKSIGDDIGLCLSKINFGNIQMKQKKWSEAEKNFTDAWQQSVALKYTSGMLGATDWLSRLYSATGRFEKAFNMQVLFKNLTDSIRNDDTRKQLMKKQLQYDFEKREAILKLQQQQKNELANKELQKQKTLRNTIIYSAILIFSFAVFAFIFYRRKREAQMKHQLADLNMRAINAQMNPHFIFNCMQSIQTLIAKKDLHNASVTLLRFAKLIRKVLDHSMSKQVTLEDELETLNDYVALEKNRLEGNLIFNVTVENEIDTNETFLPPLLLQPIVENAIVHGIKSQGGSGTIAINISRILNKIRIEITDDGGGRKTQENISARKSYGIALTKERLDCMQALSNSKSDYTAENIVDVNGNVTGTKVTLLLPFTNLAA